MKFALVIVALLVLCPYLPASAEESLDEDAHMGSAGWDLDYGFDEELDEDKDNSEKTDQEDTDNKKGDEDDFFTRRIEVYDIGTRDTEDSSSANAGQQ